MRRRYIILFLLVFSSLLSLRFSLSLFNNQAGSNGNVFSAADTFPTGNPESTGSPTISQTITPTIAETVTVNPTLIQIPSPTPIIANHIVISEVQINGSTTAQDFVELYNPTVSAVDISGWKLRKRISTGTESSVIVIPGGKSISSHGFFLWSNNINNFNLSLGADASTSATLASDNSVALLKSDDTVIDRVGWGGGVNQFVEGSPFVTNPGAGQSLERKAYSTSSSGSMSNGGSDEFKGNGFDSDNNSSDFSLRNSSQPQNTNSTAETP